VADDMKVPDVVLDRRMTFEKHVRRLLKTHWFTTDHSAM